MIPARIVGWGVALPDKVVTNADLEARLDTSDEWIRERTGIRERRHGGTTAELAGQAAKTALQRARISDGSIDLVLLATTTPEQTAPATSARVQELLGIECAAFDLNAACSGFVYALVAATGLLSVGMRRVLVVGAETLSRITDPDDRTMAVLTGDGAGAVVVAKPEEKPSIPSPGLIAWDLGCDGTLRNLLYAEIGGFLHMDGPEVFRRAVRIVTTSVEKVLADAGVSPQQVAAFVPHQANVRIMHAVADRVGIPRERVVSVIEHTGNTSAASIPLALADALDSGRIREGDLVLFAGFGAGMTWASALWRW
ncbi:MAG: 3-oxoacyl-[acyl-carrier-protein] synthase 3 [Acidimicrobiales bacterium]|nr:MAG: 3-oxoacyl-[acyl-carrier-protein] synthase 3 [Acidimicrobiales bacterium]